MMTRPVHAGLQVRFTLINKCEMDDVSVMSDENTVLEFSALRIYRTGTHT
jgi:hypothetical protein